jgi:hypothetical protein
MHYRIKCLHVATVSNFKYDKYRWTHVDIDMHRQYLVIRKKSPIRNEMSCKLRVCSVQHVPTVVHFIVTYVH